MTQLVSRTFNGFILNFFNKIINEKCRYNLCINIIKEIKIFEKLNFSKK